ncbi:Alkaline phosphatase synthesis sensor protein PhoR [Arthrobacter ulcerisalmonis]|uniref:histidine kinase n=1 Tax=Arthrobacter ulcerisalmonis TaxID=2483813 RepID=A0A3P5WT20_9MICC|nr:ATP-binding protein [Arthrobacter ulcerisalmonis]VDC18274.1 Alkaline phosphatase synthesis sensor protein PhoR [Arthrobacter ulcerisalmonis]
MAADVPREFRAPRTAIVADPDADRLASIAAALRDAHYAVRTTADAPGLAALLADGQPSVIIADSSVDVPRSEAPVLVLVDLAEAAEVAAMDRPGVHDSIAKPPAPAELVHRATALISYVSRRNTARRETEALRGRLRQVSASVRATNDPQLIAEYVVAGFGETFGADRVWLRTFEDQRVPAITASWHRPGLAPAPAGTLPSDVVARQLADHLWSRTENMTTAGADESAVPALGEVPPSSLPEAASTLAVPVGEGTSSFGIIWIAMLDGERLWSGTERGLIQHVAGNAAHGLIQSHLINSQLQVLKQLRQLDKAKTDFLATVNHELRTPLTSIMAYLDMILEGTDELPHDVHQMLDIVVRNTERLRTLIEDMLSVSHLGVDDSLLHRTPVRLGQTLDLVASALRPLAELQNVTIALDAVPEDPEILADEVQLQRVFTNLVSNAIKFTPSGGRIDVGSESHADVHGNQWATVSVADTGIGISTDEIDHVFTRFYRASNAISGEIPGTGLGLAITRDIVARHGGHIDVTSTLGAGTTVTVSLPLDADNVRIN